MEDYQKKTIEQIKARKTRLNKQGDDIIAMLYHSFSAETASASWLDSTNERVIDSFVEWALSSPTDLFLQDEYLRWKELAYETLLNKFSITKAAFDTAMHELERQKIEARMKELDHIFGKKPTE